MIYFLWSFSKLPSGIGRVGCRLRPGLVNLPQEDAEEPCHSTSSFPCYDFLFSLPGILQRNRGIEFENMASRPYPKSDLPPFKCNFPGCNAAYQRKEHVNRHMARHEGDRFPCPYCDSSLIRRDVPWLFPLKTHDSTRTNFHLAIFYVGMSGTTTQGGSRPSCVRNGPVKLARLEKNAVILNLHATDVRREGSFVHELARRRFMISPKCKRLKPSPARTW